jgi:hypothetical protein
VGDPSKKKKKKVGEIESGKSDELYTYIIYIHAWISRPKITIWSGLPAG